uniref:DENN domain-containing protein 2C n=1 Tax=Geotrypetes seraphini TaxID=260995 RepID=A0A6P8PH10_GEOSA|nr:DENN domain-containing protein 2C [Geotrypetes seraphini]XP_033774910.1 DENN domain-containing protein 2C [Geotrypetes seraphini]XP_033774911.1 DENN domain-containing protein 2C [Geotrypetes seraphini]XP_033774912.1 DENN domain-containing protein 2C [Geotrypetes seraphini]XP_033774913.1 DENN domain-containing protein 2C [Geotrypetes seraphini]
MPVMHPTGNSESGFSRSALNTLSRSHCKNIKQKISQWEGRTSGCIAEKQLLKDFGVRQRNNHVPLSKTRSDELENKGIGLSKREYLGLDFREDSGENVSEDGLTDQSNVFEISSEETETSSVSSQGREYGNTRRAFIDPEKELPPGNFYTSRGLWKRGEVIPENKSRTFALDLKRKRERCSSAGTEVNLKVLADETMTVKSLENIYCDSDGPDSKSTINPVPKPRRTFRYSSEQDHRVHSKSNGGGTATALRFALPCEHSEQKRFGNGIRPRSKRKSFEFEDVQTYRRFMAQVNTPQVPEETHENSNSALYHALSEDNIYEDIIYSPKENPYEDIKISPLPLWRVPSTWKLPPPRCTIKTPKFPMKPHFLRRQTLELKSTKLYIHKKICKDSTLPVTLTEWKVFKVGETALKKRKKFPRLVLRIQDIFDSKRGKKRVKLHAYAGQEAIASKGEFSDNESDSEDRQKKHNKRLAHVYSSLKRNPHYQTLERDLIEFQEQQLFEFFVVVSLQKKPTGNTYTPSITQQYPTKAEQPLRQSRDTEERLKVIPSFCFPDSKDWVPTSELKSETFSFVLTGEDGSRWFGYCKKLLPHGKGKRLPEVYCIVSRLGCFNLFSKILDEVEKRREMSPALVSPFMRSVMEAPFPAPGRTITVKSFLPGAGNEVIELCRPMDSRLEHVDFDCLYKCLSVCHLIKVFASLLLERRVIFVADNLSTLSKCGHAVVAMLYPFTWQHTYIPVLPVSMIDIVCSPTPFLIGILSCCLPLLGDLPIEEVLIVDLCGNKFLQQIADEDDILPHKLQAALVQILEYRNDILAQEQHFTEEDMTLNSLVSEAFVRFFVEIVGHYSLHMYVNEKGERIFQREPFRKSHTSRSVRQFLDLFMETQMFAGFIQDRELRKSGVKGLFELRACEYLESIPETEPSGVNKFLRGLGNKMKFLQKK